MNLNNEKIIVVIENAVIEQVEASGFTGELHRLDGEKIVDVILQQIEGFVLVPQEPTELFKEHLKNHLFDLWAGDHGCDWDGFVSVDAINHNTIWKMMIEAQEQSHE